jgi:hypothetical protein
MTTWSEKTVSHAEWQSVQTDFINRFHALNKPKDMMLVCVVGTPDAKTARLIAALPDGMPLYDGFVEIEPEQLPDTTMLLVGYHELWEALFGHASQCPPNQQVRKISQKSR